MKMTLYEIDQRIDELFDPETGEIFDIEALEALEMARHDKIANVGCLIKNIEAMNDAIKKEIDTLTARKKAGENTVERLKKYALEATGGAKFEDARCRISFTTRDKVEIEPNLTVDDVPAEYVRVKTTRDFDKMIMKEALAAGAEIKGVKLVKNTSVIVK